MQIRRIRSIRTNGAHTRRNIPLCGRPCTLPLCTGGARLLLVGDISKLVDAMTGGLSVGRPANVAQRLYSGA